LRKTIKILVIEDTIQDYLILKEYISRVDSFDPELVHCESVSDAGGLLNSQKFDLIFLDLFLVDTFGRDSFLKLKQLEGHTPIVVLSGLTDKSIALEIVQLGAQEYIVKGDFDEMLIEKAIIYSIERHKFQKRVQLSEERHRLTFKNAGVALAEYDARELYDFIQELKLSGLKHPSEYPIVTLEQGMEIRQKISMIVVNDEALRLFEMDDKQDFSDNYRLVHTSDSLDIFQSLFAAIWNEDDSFEIITTYKRKISNDDLILLSRVSLFGFEEKKCNLIKSGTDISELVQKENQIARQNHLAESLSNSTMSLLRADVCGNQLVTSLGVQAEALGVDLVTLIEFESKKDGLYLKKNSQWTVHEAFKSKNNEWLYETSVNNLKIGSVFDQPRKGEIVRLSLEDELLDPNVRAVIERTGLTSLLISPVFVKGVMLSAIVYGCVDSDKECGDAELTTIKSFSNAVGSFMARNRAENELIELNAQLEDRIMSRTEDLTEAIGELESFSYSVSHDLRAPLRKVGGFSQILEKEYSEELPKRAKHLLNNIKDGATEMSQLIHDLLEFSQLGRRNLSFSNIDMNDLCEDVIKDTVNLYPNLNISIKLNALENAKGDRNLVKHALSNLVRNAVKFSSKNELIEINVNCIQEGSMNTYSIADNGIGIDMKYADKIFSVFQRLHTKDQYEGTGVGLAIVKRIIKRHNGKVSVQGELGEGTTFSFSLPASSAKFASAENPVKIPARNPVSIE